ncbi:MAG: NFACT family protein [Candidatus Woesearchaeota archaeon]|jgi:predicted ribosome quality control (RQC) complex YloA/Tae2 family protein|nr:NFACT family protein [Candidatus Woesearchaeota archaeon]MDP7610746.1 NFACT family protein [Candidatus Woesearchaeota archaeon]
MNQLSALDIYYLLKEFKTLIGSKINNVYQLSKKEFYFQLHTPNKGKSYLKISLPSFIFLTEKKETIETPSNFSIFLRKHLNNARIRSISQKNFERIIEIQLEKETTHILIIELFSKGNIILCDENYTIISQLEQQKWSQREIKKGITYKYPEKAYNFIALKQPELTKALKQTKKDKLVTFLATELSLGGLYSEEVCTITNIDKTKKPSLLKEKEISLLFSAFKTLKTRTPDLKGFKTFSSLIESSNKTETKNPEEIRFQKQKDKLTSILQTQEDKIKELNQKEEEHKKKAELIYSNYNLIKTILKDIIKAKEKYSWEEIKAKLKGHKIVKEVNTKDKTIVLEIN